MAKTDYAENILQAVDTVVNAAIGNLQFDKTIVATIADAGNASKGVYTVSNGNTVFQAYTDKTDYDVDDAVYVSIPNGDYTRQKMIVGRYIASSTSYYNYTSPWKKFIDVSGDLVDDDKIPTASLLANGPTDIDNGILAHEANGTQKVLWSTDDIEAGDGYTCIGLRAGFKTMLDDLGTAAGSYGLQLIVRYQNPTSTAETPETRAVKFELNDTDMYGDPFNFETFYNQTKLFDVSGLGTITGLTLSLYQGGNFYKTDGSFVPYTQTVTRSMKNSIGEVVDENKYTQLLSDNIIASNIYVALGYNMDDFEGDAVLLYTPDSKDYDKNADNNQKTLKVRWIHKDEETDTVTCYDSTARINEVASLHWYKYNQSKGISDKWAGTFWQEIENWQDEFEITMTPDFAKAQDQYKVIIETPLYDGLIADAMTSDKEIEDAKNKLDTAKLVYDEASDNFAAVASESNYRKYIQAKTNYEDEQKAFDALAVNYLADLKMLESNVLTFNNANPVVDSITADVVQGLSIVCDAEGYKGVYYLYDCTNEMTNKSEAQIKRKLVAEYCSLSDDNDVLETADSITWKIPKSNTMITTPQSGIEYDKEDSFTETEDGYYEITRTAASTGIITISGYTNISTEQYFRINDYYVANATNNTITCIVTKDDVKYSASVELSFGPTGTNGTDYTFLIKMPPERTCLYKGDKNDPLEIIPSLLDYNNLFIEDFAGCVVTYDWYCKDSIDKIVFCDARGNPKKNSEGKYAISYTAPETGSESESRRCYIRSLTEAEIKANNPSATADDLLPFYYILHASLKTDATSHGNNLGKVVLDAYLPIPYSLNVSNYNHISGSDKIIYNTAGECDYYYKDKYLLLNNKEEQVPVTWFIKSAENNNIEENDESSSPSYSQWIPHITASGQLEPLSTFTSGLDKRVAVIAKTSDSSRVWIQPLLFYQNAYSSALLNAWDGSLTIDEDTGTIMSTMLGAGYKDSQNRYNGVLIGDVKTAADGYAGTGVYGYNEGQQSFGLNIDGTAFFGKAGRGRIELDGNSSTIQNSTYGTDGTGMQIDLDDGFIRILGNQIITRTKTSNADGTETTTDITFVQLCDNLITKYTNLANASHDKEISIYQEMDRGNVTDAASAAQEAQEAYQKYKKYAQAFEVLKTGYYEYTGSYIKNIGLSTKNDDGTFTELTGTYTTDEWETATKNTTIYLKFDNSSYEKVNTNLRLTQYLSKNYGVKSLSSVILADEVSEGTQYDYKSTGSEIKISAQNPYLTITSGTSNHTDLLKIADSEYYLQSDNYKADITHVDETTHDTIIDETGAGVKIDLCQGTFDAHNFTLNSSCAEGQFEGSYFYLSDSGNPFFQVHYKDNKANLENDLMYIGYNRFELNSSNWDDSSDKIEERSGLQLNLTEGTLTAYDGFDLYAYNKGSSTDSNINRHKGSFVHFSSSGNPYFQVHYEYTVVDALADSDYYNSDKQQTAQLSQDLIEISNSNFILQSRDFGYYKRQNDTQFSPRGTQIDLQKGTITSYQFDLEAEGWNDGTKKGTLTIDSSAKDYPLKVEGVSTKEITYQETEIKGERQILTSYSFNVNEDKNDVYPSANFVSYLSNISSANLQTESKHSTASVQYSFDSTSGTRTTDIYIMTLNGVEYRKTITNNFSLQTSSIASWEMYPKLQVVYYTKTKNVVTPTPGETVTPVVNDDQLEEAGISINSYSMAAAYIFKNIPASEVSITTTDGSVSAITIGSSNGTVFDLNYGKNYINSTIEKMVITTTYPYAKTQRLDACGAFITSGGSDFADLNEVNGFDYVTYLNNILNTYYETYSSQTEDDSNNHGKEWNTSGPSDRSSPIALGELSNTLYNYTILEEVVVTNETAKDQYFRVNWDGTAEMNAITAVEGGKIGPFTITKDCLYKGTSDTMLAGQGAVYLGVHGISVGKAGSGFAAFSGSNNTISDSITYKDWVTKKTVHKSTFSNGDVVMSGDLYIAGSIIGDNWRITAPSSNSDGGGSGSTQGFGNINASGGLIGGWTINVHTLCNGTAIILDPDSAKVSMGGTDVELDAAGLRFGSTVLTINKGPAGGNIKGGSALSLSGGSNTILIGDTAIWIGISSGITVHPGIDTVIMDNSTFTKDKVTLPGMDFTSDAITLNTKIKGDAEFTGAFKVSNDAEITGSLKINDVTITGKSASAPISGTLGELAFADYVTKKLDVTLGGSVALASSSVTGVKSGVGGVGTRYVYIFTDSTTGEYVTYSTSSSSRVGCDTHIATVSGVDSKTVTATLNITKATAVTAKKEFQADFYATTSDTSNTSESFTFTGEDGVTVTVSGLTIDMTVT